MTVSWHLKFTTLMFIKSRKSSQIITGIVYGIQLYAKYGFVVSYINGNNGFEAIIYHLPKVEPNITAEE